jgi:long-chain acyl-CoA synthetase
MLRTACAKWNGKAAMLVPADGGFREISYEELWTLVRNFAGALNSLGLAAGDRVAIQAENCYEWALADWACLTLGVVAVPIYTSLPPDQSQYIVRDSGAKVVLSGSPELAAKTSGMEGVRSLPLTGEGSLKELAESGQFPFDVEEWNRRIDAVAPEDVATIIYTSGTTGPPKGAVLPHRAPVFLCEQIPKSLPIDHRDVFLCFLPMSHVFERIAGQFLPLSCGATIGYSKGLASLAGDIQAVRPTILFFVPRFLEAFRDRILDALKKESSLKRALFEWTLSQGLRRAKGGFAPFAGLLDAIVGAKIRARFGGRIRFFVSGAAALPPRVAEFYLALRLLILQGYGLTETSAATTVNHPDRSKYWTVGEPIDGVEVKIAEDGEILVRGPTVMLGYHNLPKETGEAIDAEGWFHTGDIGEWEGEHLKITDRKKDLLILANGKNVAPQPIENRLRESPWISEAVLFGDGSEYVYGLIVPDFDKFDKLLKETGESALSKAELTRHPKVLETLKAEIDAVNRSIADYERVKKWTAVEASFSQETGELTPTLKVRRKVVREKFAETLKELQRG